MPGAPGVSPSYPTGVPGASPSNQTGMPQVSPSYQTGMPRASPSNQPTTGTRPKTNVAAQQIIKTEPSG